MKKIKVKDVGFLSCFVLGGIMFRYGVDLLDLFIQHITNKQTYASTVSQMELNKKVAEYEKESVVEGTETQVVGFEIPTEELYDEEYK